MGKCRVHGKASQGDRRFTQPPKITPVGASCAKTDERGTRKTANDKPEQHRMHSADKGKPAHRLGAGGKGQGQTERTRRDACGLWLPVLCNAHQRRPLGGRPGGRQVSAPGRSGGPAFDRPALIFRTLPQDFFPLGAGSRYPLLPFFWIIGKKSGSRSISGRLVLRFWRMLNHDCTTKIRAILTRPLAG
ncbi:hypothetical protein GCM10011402_24860 [Paracoccus acridae]|uniref:Uncharacterized protein n=2 Tax=Paracoccus acridae TaxID=1795310 RepID=A0ABQ1VJJ5_9RHOB|nr:hypothetical protein GCM10011402_24860 [Paracoccus acridae]